MPKRATPPTSRRSAAPPVAAKTAAAPRRKAVAYVRVSTAEQGAHGYSLDDQKALLARYCAARGVELVATFEDRESAKTRDTDGASFSSRPGWTRLQAFVEASRDVGLVVFKDYSRFSRDATDALAMIRRLERLGVEVQAAEQPIDWDVPEQWPLVLLYVGMPDADNRRRSLNVVRGIRRAREEGRWTTTPPLGYARALDDRERMVLVPDPEMAPYVVQAFEMMGTGQYAADALWKMLRAAMPARLRTRWYTSRYRFGQMLRNPVYAGRVVVPAWKDEPERIVEGLHVNIVPVDLWERVQFVLDGRAPRADAGKVRATHVPELPLRGHLLCPRTSARLTGSASTSRAGERVFYYHGQGRGAYRVRADEANSAFEAHLGGIAVPAPVAALFAAHVDEVSAEAKAERDAERVRAHNALVAVDEKLVRADEVYVEGRIEADSYARLKAKYIAERQSLQGEIDRLAGLPDDLAGVARFGLDVLSNLRAWWQRLGPEGRALLVGSIWPSGVVFDGEGYRTSPTSELMVLLTGRNLSVRAKNDESALREEGAFVSVGHDVPWGGADGTRTRDLRRDRAAF